MQSFGLPMRDRVHLYSIRYSAREKDTCGTSASCSALKLPWAGWIFGLIRNILVYEF
ncbi:hypothetical protein FG05_35388 [Fusarium graminearum]|nr:hypothetical protein FG05_35388 [Fusarium graminearum]